MSSFNLDLSGMVGYAADFFNSLSSLIVVIGGIALGMAIFVGVLALVRKLRFT